MYCLYIDTSKLQECERLQGDLGAPGGGQHIPAGVTEASAIRAAASAGGEKLDRSGNKEEGSTDPWVGDKALDLTQSRPGTAHRDSYLGLLSSTGDP